jgi:hypothetical protein
MAVLRPIYCALIDDVTKAARNLSTSKLFVPKIDFFPLTFMWPQCLFLNTSLDFFQFTKSFRPHYGPGVDSASDTNEYQESSWGYKAADA